MNEIINASNGISEIWQILGNIIGILLASVFIIEIAPIKVNPLKFLFEWISRGFKSWFSDVIGDSLNKQLDGIKEEDKKRDEAIIKMDTAIENIVDKVDQITERIDQNEERAQKNHISLLRNQVLTYANNLRAGADPSKESFEYVLSQIDEYNDFVKKNKIENNCMVLSEALILEQYKIRFNTINPD